MNYYSFHIGDYAAHTRHLSLIEDLAYRRLLDLYYTSEKPIPLDVEKASRLIGLREYSDSVSVVLSDFFLKSEEGYINKRCDAEIEVYKAKADRAKNANKKRWDSNKSDTSLKSDKKTEQCLIPTKNQEPITNNQYIKPIGVAKATKAKRLDLETLPVEWDRFCKTERPELNPQEVFAQFRDYWIAQGGQRGCKLDWLATWRNWVRNQKASIKTKQDQGNEAFHQLTGGMLKPKPNDAVFQSIAQTVDMESDHARLR